MSPLRRFLLLALFGLHAWAASPAAARPVVAQAEGVRLSVTAGFDGFYRGEAWIPVTIAAANDGPDVVGRLQVTAPSAGRSPVRFETPLSLPNRSAKQVMTFVFPPRLVDRLTVTLLDERGRELAQAESNVLRRLETGALLYGVLSPEPDALAFLDSVTAGRPEAAVAYLASSDMPTVPAAWGPLDILVFNGNATGDLGPDQIAALAAWVEAGGQLVVTGGPSWQVTTSSVADWLPVSVSGVRSVPDLPGFAAAIGAPFRDPGPYLLADATLRQGEVLFFDEGAPLLARVERGQGAVYFLSLDPRLAPLADWRGSDTVWEAVATRVPTRPIWSQGIRDVYAAISAVESLPELALPSPALLLLFLLLYVVTIGPVNYLVLKRRGRLELAWFTIPALIVGFTGLAYLLGFGLKGNTTILNQMSVVSGEVGVELGRSQTLIGLYSPRRGRFDLELPISALARPLSRDSGELSGDGRQGVVERNGSLVVREIGVDVSDVATVVADSIAPLPAVTGEAVLMFTGGAAEVSFMLRNDGTETLQTGSLIVGNDVFGIGDLEAGETWRHTVALSGSGGSSRAVPGPIATFGGIPPLSPHYPVLLGSALYYEDRELYARWQLLQALEDRSGAGTSGLSVGSATFVAWTREPQLTMALDGGAPRQSATTLYMLDLPLTQAAASTADQTVPQALWSWRVLASSGVFDVVPTDLRLFDGWVEFEFEPWPTFQTMSVTELGVRLEPKDGTSTLPQARLWDWQEEAWESVPVSDWGVTLVPAFAPFVGPRNAVRLRLSSGPAPVVLSAAFPVLRGRSIDSP